MRQWTQNGFRYKKKFRWRCRIRSCRKAKGVKTNNWLQSTKVKLPTIVHFIYDCRAHELTSLDFFKREFALNRATVVDWNNYTREVCV